MRRVLIGLAIVACSSTPGARRFDYAITGDSTFAGAPSTAISLDASFVDDTVFVLRRDPDVHEGFGLRRNAETFDVVLYHHVNPPPTFPATRRYNTVLLLVVHPDGTGELVAADRVHAAFRYTRRGDELVLDGQPVGHTIVQLAADGTATLAGDLIARVAVHARFEDDLLIAISSDVAYSNLSVGRYDFARGRGENASPRGRGIETFARRP